MLLLSSLLLTSLNPTWRSSVKPPLLHPITLFRESGLSRVKMLTGGGSGIAKVERRGEHGERKGADAERKLHPAHVSVVAAPETRKTLTAKVNVR